jgi:hypothetical protein
MRKILAPVLVVLAAAIGGFAVFGSAPATGLDDAFRGCLERQSDQLRYECATALIESSFPSRPAAEVNDAIIAATAAGGLKGLQLCHKSSEYLGSRQAAIQGRDALDELIYSCLGGTVHGVFYALGLEYDAAEMAAMSAGVCERFGEGQPWVYGWDCRHGVGHAIAEDESLTIPELTEHCDRVYPDLAGREDCGSGLIGGLIERIMKNNEILGFDRSDPIGWCAELDAPYDRACKQRSGLLAASAGFDDDAIAQLCEPGDNDCLYGIGFHYGQAIYPLTPEQRLERCAGFDEQGRLACVAGIIRAITPDYWLNEEDPGVCAAAGRDEAFCRDEQEQMRLRELTISQINGDAPYELLTGDAGAWPAELRPKR